MKKIICVLLSFVFLCSCSAKTDVRVVNKGLSFKAHIFYAQKEYYCLVNISEDMTAAFEFDSGILKGLTAVCKADSVTLAYKDKQSKRMPEEVSNAFFAEIYKAFAFFENNEYTVENEDECFFAQGKTEAGEFRLTVSPSGLPMQISIPLKEIEAQFYDVTLKNTD